MERKEKKEGEEEEKLGECSCLRRIMITVSYGFICLSLISQGILNGQDNPKRMYFFSFLFISFHFYY